MSRFRRILAGVLAIATVLGLGCEGDDEIATSEVYFEDDDAGDDDFVSPQPELDIASVRFPVPIEGMVLVPEGLGPYGCDAGFDPGCREFDEELTLVYVSAYWIDAAEVSVGEYRACVAEGTCEDFHGIEIPDVEEERERPARGLGAADAEAYCVWAGKRVPDDVEWERAARGLDGRYYPWGNAWCAECCNWCDGADCDGATDGFADVAPVSAFADADSPYGAVQMAGNVWEWTLGSYPDDPENPLWMLRGGAYVFVPDIGDDGDITGQYRATRRLPMGDGAQASPIAGIRCVADPVWE